MFREGNKARAVRGRDGLLFLDNDRNRVFAQHAGKYPIQECEIEVWKTETTRRKNVCEALGAIYVQLIAPDKHAVYPHALPQGAVSTRRRPVYDVLRALEGITNPVYPLKELKASYGLGDLYGTTDTHWTDLGAFVALRALAKRINRFMIIPEFPLDTFQVVSESIVGDLGQKCRPIQMGRGCRLQNDLLFRAECIVDNGVNFTGQLRVLRDETGISTAKTCVVFGNSFCSDFVQRLLTLMFGKTVFVFSDNVDYELLCRERPHIVIHQLCERFLIQAPRDRLKLSGRERGFIRALDENRAMFRRRFAARREAVEAGSPECLEILAEKELLRGNHGTAKQWHERAESLDKTFSLKFPWALALGMAHRDAEAISALTRAAELFPDRNYVKKYVMYMLHKQRYESVRSVGKLLMGKNMRPSP